MGELHRHDEFVGYRVYEAHRSLVRCIERVLAPFGITSVVWNALNQLEKRGPLTQTQLAEVLRKEQATITRAIDRMAKAGLVERTPDEKDRRVNIVSVTPYASELLTAIEPHAVTVAAAVVDGISEEELEVFFSVLEKVVANADRIETK